MTELLTGPPPPDVISAMAAIPGLSRLTSHASV